jgi:glutamate carboxypeptidase
MNELYVNLLAKLVNIDSGTGDVEGIAEVAALVISKLTDLQFDFQTLEGLDGSKHYYASRGKGKRILLIAHLDTVFAKGTTAKRKFQIEGDVARGPGVSDCKSGVVTIIGALEQLSKEQWPGYEIGCLFNSDEEIGSPGSRTIIERLAHGSEAVIVVEPAEGETLTISRKGIARFMLRVFGKASHSGSNYHDGRNAILEIAHKVIDIQALTDTLPGVTLNVGVISGGVRPNIVPDYAEAEIDLRVESPGQYEQILQELQRITDQTSVSECSAKLSGVLTRPPMALTEANMRLFNVFKEVGTEMGISIGVFQSGGGSDANITAAQGIPTIDGVGPIGGGHHSEEEYLNITSLHQRIELLARFLKVMESY